MRDLAGDTRDFPDVEQWLGRRWIDTVTQESRIKIEEMLAHPPAAVPNWRQVNHSGTSELPLRYRAIRLANGATVAIARDERATARLQQRLLQVQQSLERDYLRLRQAESRYRLLFEMTAEPMLIIDSATLRVREINPAASQLIGAHNSLAGQPLVAQVSADYRDRLIAFLGAAATGANVAPVHLVLARSDRGISLSARLFRQQGDGYFLVQLAPTEHRQIDAKEHLILDLVERLPDAFVLTDNALTIVTANSAFVELIQEATVEPLAGRPLGDFLGRPGIDLDLIRAQVGEHGVARNVATVLRGSLGGIEEVEVSAVRTGEAQAHYAFTMRMVARRLRDLPPVTRDLPRSVEQLTDLVGRMPLKDIVRESTDLIERLCIEAALNYTSNNRASAAEILGLSRQSLYSKLHRHGMAKADDTEAAAE
ncbi:transcriptional regulator PpsR [Sphingomonas rosea]|uniref:Transcriptional regulator PpsR n=1 Tax=Sphingomonas rosea TaxID=335605 RepID=A0ABP7U5C4_9SPHN